MVISIGPLAQKASQASGELRKSNRDRHGTEVRLRLRDDAMPEGSEVWCQMSLNGIFAQRFGTCLASLN